MIHQQRREQMCTAARHKLKKEGGEGEEEEEGREERRGEESRGEASHHLAGEVMTQHIHLSGRCLLLLLYRGSKLTGGERALHQHYTGIITQAGGEIKKNDTLI